MTTSGRDSDARAGGYHVVGRSTMATVEDRLRILLRL
jgi:hypothetical protein